MEAVLHHARPKRAGWVKTAAGEVDANKLSNEEREADADGRDEGSLVLLCCQHEDTEHQLSRKHHLDEQTLHHSRASSEACLDRQWAGKHTADQRSSGDTSEDLHEEEQSASQPRNRTDKAHPERDGRVEQSTADAEEDPGIYCE